MDHNEWAAEWPDMPYANEVLIVEPVNVNRVIRRKIEMTISEQKEYVL